MLTAGDELCFGRVIVKLSRGVTEKDCKGLTCCPSLAWDAGTEGTGVGGCEATSTELPKRAGGCGGSLHVGPAESCLLKVFVSDSLFQACRVLHHFEPGLCACYRGLFLATSSHSLAIERS